MNRPVLQGGAVRRRRRWPLAVVLLVVLAAVAGAVALSSGGGEAGGTVKPRFTARLKGVTNLDARARDHALPRRPPPGIAMSGPNDVVVHLSPKPAAAMLFDVDSGRSLWRLHPMRVRPIASLTKLMTVLLAVERLPT